MNKLSKLALFALAAMTFCSCDEDDNGGKHDDLVIWDLMPAGIDIRIIDPQGADLLSESVEGNWIGYEFTGIYDDKDYTLKWDLIEHDHDSRMTMAEFTGLTARCLNEWNGSSWNEIQGKYTLYFGEFDSYKDQDITLKLAVPELDYVATIVYTHRIAWNNNKPKITNYVSLDGGRQNEGSTVEVVLPRRTQE